MSCIKIDDLKPMGNKFIELSDLELKSVIAGEFNSEYIERDLKLLKMFDDEFFKTGNLYVSFKLNKT